MTGLFVKDFRLMRQNRQSILIFIALALIMGLTQSNTFIMGYLPFCMAIFVTSLISYDEVDNGFQFLMTLPVSRSLYVNEKYILCMGSAIISWILSAVLYFVSKVLHGSVINSFSDIQVVVAFLPVIVIALSVMIPVQLKFGVEKSRIVLICLAGSIIAAIYVVTEVLNPDTLGIILWLDSLNETGLAVAGLIFMVVAAVFSWLISRKIMMKKEF